jgi:hypothetical protein
VITLSGYRTWIGADNIVERDIREYKDYKLAASISYTAAGRKNTYQVWVYKGER